MTVEDAKQLDRTAQLLVVEARRGYGSPPAYESQWLGLWDVKVDRVEINRGLKPSTATIWFPSLRWDESAGIVKGDMVRIRTDEQDPADRTIVFSGFATSDLSDFSGGSVSGGAFERYAVVCMDYRWLLSTTCPLYGQMARGPDDYDDYATASQSPIDDSYTFLSGRRAIFNENGRANKDPAELTFNLLAGAGTAAMPIFAGPEIAEPWTARDMLRYVLSPLWNRAYLYLPIADAADLSGVDHADWDKVLSHIIVDTLSVLDAIGLICRHLGWDFREDYANDGSVNLVFYKVASASTYTRDSDNATILHKLYAPIGGNITDAVARGEKMLWSMTLAQDIAAVINNPWGLGTPDRFEFSAELVPGWLDSDLEPDTSDSNANLFKLDADLEGLTDPDALTFYKYYHPSGSSFKRDVGRKWVLNETGKYSAADTYNRGMPFDFADVIPAYHILDAAGKRLYAPFNRQLLPCLTFDKDTLNSVGIKVEISFDSGSTWQVIGAAISSLPSEAGIYIDEPNLAEMLDKKAGTISGGDLDGIEINFFTSLADDKVNSRVFKDGDWLTRLRITASIQMDRRLNRQSFPSSASGSPFHHSQVYDFSEKYGITERTESSSYADSGLPAWNIDATDWFDKHLEGIREANEDMSISGAFALERLWLGDGSGAADFAIGDCIERVTGREYDLSASMGSATVYPEIVQIIYMPDIQRMKLITRDLRFAEVVL